MTACQHAEATASKSDAKDWDASDNSAVSGSGGF